MFLIGVTIFNIFRIQSLLGKQAEHEVEGNVISIAFTVYARGLPVGLDTFNGLPDAYVVFFKNSGVNGTWEKLLVTQPVHDTRKPIWEEVFVDSGVVVNREQRWRFDVWDFDPFGRDDYIGSVTIPVEELVNLRHTFLPKRIEPSLPSSGYLIFSKSY